MRDLLEPKKRERSFFGCPTAILRYPGPRVPIRLAQRCRVEQAAVGSRRVLEPHREKIGLRGEHAHDVRASFELRGQATTLGAQQRDALPCRRERIGAKRRFGRQHARRRQRIRRQEPAQQRDEPRIRDQGAVLAPLDRRLGERRSTARCPAARSMRGSVRRRLDIRLARRQRSIREAAASSIRRRRARPDGGLSGCKQDDLDASRRPRRRVEAEGKVPD